MKRLRLVKILVQPILVADDGEQLEEVALQPITVRAEDWPAYSAEAWPQFVAEAEQQLNASGSGVGAAEAYADIEAAVDAGSLSAENARRRVEHLARNGGADEAEVSRVLAAWDDRALRQEHERSLP